MAWITTDELKSALGLEPADTYDAAWLDNTVAAVNALLIRWRPDINPAYAREEFDTQFVQPSSFADVHHGGLELAVKMYRSRGATDDGTGSYDVYAYAARYVDANISMLIGLDRPVTA